MPIIIFSSQAWLKEIVCTPDLENGIGPVLIGTPLQAQDGRVAIAHPFDEITCDWFEAYMQRENPPCQVVDALPGNFIPVTAE